MIITPHCMQSLSFHKAVAVVDPVNSRAAVITQHRLLTRARKMLNASINPRNHLVKCATDSVVEGATLHDRPPSAGQLTLYTHMLCPYAQRCYTTLLCKASTSWPCMLQTASCHMLLSRTSVIPGAVCVQQVPHQTFHIDLSNKPSWYGNVNEKGLVPAVDYKGRVFTESIDICRSAGPCV